MDAELPSCWHGVWKRCGAGNRSGGNGARGRDALASRHGAGSGSWEIPLLPRARLSPGSDTPCKPAARCQPQLWSEQLRVRAAWEPESSFSHPCTSSPSLCGARWRYPGMQDARREGCLGMWDARRAGWLILGDVGCSLCRTDDAWGCRMLSAPGTRSRGLTPKAAGRSQRWVGDAQGCRTLSVSAPLRKEHPLERGGPGMQQCLIGQRDLWSLRVAIPTCLGSWAELVPRGGPRAGGKPGLCQPGGARLPLPEAPQPRASPGCCSPPLPAPFLQRGRRAGTAPGVSPWHPAACPEAELRCTSAWGEPSLVAFWLAARPHGTIPAQNFPAACLPPGSRAWRLPRCRCPPRRAAAPAADAHGLAAGWEGSVLPQASPGARRSRGLFGGRVWGG